MSQSFRVGIEGDKQLAAALKRLGDTAATRVVRPALQKAAKVVLDASIAAAPVDDGVLRDAMIMKIKTYRRQVVVGIVGADVAKAPHAHLVELGTGPRVTHKGRSAGVMRANAFMRRAFDQSRAAAERTLQEEIARGIEREAKRA